MKRIAIALIDPLAVDAFLAEAATLREMAAAKCGAELSAVETSASAVGTHQQGAES